MSVSPIRILYCHHSADFGGGSDRSLFELVTRLPKEQYTVCMVLRIGDPMALQYRDAGIEVFEIPLVAPRRARSPLSLLHFLVNLPLAGRRVARKARSFNANLVHVNTLPNLQGALGARWARVPLIWHIRELMPGSKGYALLARIAVRWASKVVAISNSVAAELPASDKVSVILNGVEPKNYHERCAREDARVSLGLDTNKPLIVLPARIESWKGQHVLVEAAPIILAKHPDVQFVFAGNPAINKPHYIQEVKTRCQELGIERHMHFIGQRGDIATVLTASDILVSCSVTPEPFGRTLVEAMHANRPVIATHGGGPEDIVEDGYTGLLVDPGDPNALADAVIALLDDPDRAKRIAEAGRIRAEEHFTVERLLQDVIQLYKDTTRIF